MQYAYTHKFQQNKHAWTDKHTQSHEEETHMERSAHGPIRTRSHAHTDAHTLDKNSETTSPSTVIEGREVVANRYITFNGAVGFIYAHLHTCAQYTQHVHIHTYTYTTWKYVTCARIYIHIHTQRGYTRHLHMHTCT